MADEYYVGGMIEVCPAPPAQILTGTRFDPATLDARKHDDDAPQVWLITDDPASHALADACDLVAYNIGEIAALHPDCITLHPERIAGDLTELVALLGDGFTYHGSLRIDSGSGEPPSRIRVAQIGDARIVQEHSAEYVYPADYGIPDGPAVVFNPDATRAWLSERRDDGTARAVQYNLSLKAMYDPTADDSPGDWLCRLLNDASDPDGLPPHAWRLADSVQVEVVETVGVGNHADGGAVLVVEVGGLRLASQWFGCDDLGTYGGDPYGRPTVPQLDVAIQALTAAAAAINWMVEHHRTVRAADAATRSIPELGPLSRRLGAEDIETALVAFNELVSSLGVHDPGQVLTEQQRRVLWRTNDLYEAMVAEANREADLAAAPPGSGICRPCSGWEADPATHPNCPDCGNPWPERKPASDNDEE